MSVGIDQLGAGSSPAACARTARSVDRPIPPWATRSASLFTRQLARIRFTPAGDAQTAWVARAETLTPYDLEVLLDDVRRAGAGARLDLELPADTDDAGVAATRGRLGPLVARGVDVSVRRARHNRPAA